MFSTGRRRIAWLLASTLLVACGGTPAKVEEPRASASAKDDEVDPDEFAITDEDDREVAGEEEPAEEKTADEEPSADEVVAEAEEAAAPPPKAKPKKQAKKQKKVVEPEPEEVAAADEEEDEPVEERPAKPERERVNRRSQNRRREEAGIGSGREDREARMARDERARAKARGGRGREEEDAEERAEREEAEAEAKAARAEKAREAKQARAAKARAAKEAKAEKLRAAKAAKAEKLRAAKEAKAEKLRAAKEAKAENARKAQEARAAKANEDEDVADEEDTEDEDEAPPKKVAKASKKEVDENLIEMEGDDEEDEEDDEESSTRVASVEDDPLAAGPPVRDEEPEPVAAPKASPINDRPLTVAAKQLEVHGGLGLQTLTLPGAMAGTTVSSTSEALALGVAYGIGKNAEVGADYRLSINPGTVKGPLAFHVAYAAKHSAKIDVAIAANLGFDFFETANAVTMTTTTTTKASLQLGAWARYRATPKVSIFTGLPALPSAATSLSNQSLALPPFGYQVQIGLNNAGATAIEVPIGIGLQVKPNIYAFASLDFAHIRLANTQTALIFADFIPLALGAFYTHDKLDIGVQLADDLKQGADYLRLETVLRYSVK
ncbi:MAG: hypothetical protein HOV81_44680 [Kofleriaceae bacterium]|nr:hypothetical protein [Kofleriaceae bacterium]